MVGPGEVDAELEPEVKEECEGKYGEIIKVKITETPGVVEEEAVRIFLEFRRQECAIKGGVSPFIDRVPCLMFQLWWISMEGSSVEEKCVLHFTRLKIFIIMF